MAEPRLTPLIFDSEEALAEDTARACLDHLALALKERPTVRWVLSGGRTPLALYRALIRLAASLRLPWERVHIHFTDERWVPPGHPESNLGAAQAALLSPLGVPAGNVHPLIRDLDAPERQAALADEALRRLAPPLPVFDLVILGLGEDGHTASLFPDSPLLDEKLHWVAAVTGSPKPPPTRITLTPPALRSSRRSMVLVAGPGKSASLPRLLRDARLPIHRVAPEAGLEWRLDRSAAGNLGEGPAPLFRASEK